MKTISLTILFSLFFAFVFSQQQNFKITYRHCVQFDTTTSLRDTIGLEAVLIGNNTESNYSFAKAPKQKIKDTLFGGKPIVDLANVKQSGTYITKGNGIKYDLEGNIVHQNKKNQLLSLREKMKYEYVITEESIPVINWEITEETRIIKTYHCKMAVAYFRGRYYKAWFTTDVPIVAAPWKFFGLPGLVMDIEDNRHQVKLYVEKIEYPVDEKVPSFVNNGRKISLDQYFTFRNEDFIKGVQASRVEFNNPEYIKEMIATKAPRSIVIGLGAYYGIELR